MLQCNICSEPATHVLVDKMYTIIEPRQFFCEEHAFTDDREKCTCCENFSGHEVEVDIDADGEPIETVELKRTYPVSELDEGFMCSSHP